MGHFYSVGSLLQWPALTQPRLWMWFLFERWIGGPRRSWTPVGTLPRPRLSRPGGESFRLQCLTYLRFRHTAGQINVRTHVSRAWK
jgi:hypothetical protein